MGACLDDLVPPYSSFIKPSRFIPVPFTGPCLPIALQIYETALLFMSKK